MEVEDHERIPSPSRKNHRSPSPDGGSTEVGESKRLKHHHHHRHHRHHRRRHHSKKSREKEEGDDVAVDEKADGVLDVNRAVVVQDDGELEEGEIIEEGEIKPETSNLVFSAEDNSYSEKEVKVLDGDLDALHKENSCDLMNHVTEDQHYDISSEKIDAIPRFGDAPMTQGKSSEKVNESGDSENYHTGRNVSINKDYDTGNGDLQNRKRSKSPFCRGIYAMKYKDRDEENETTYSDNSMGKHVDNGDIRHTPSRTRHNEVHHRNRSRSHDTDSERVNGDSRVDRHKVRNRTSNADVDRGHSERERSSSDIKRDGREARHGERDGQKKIDGGIHRERERSASYSRHSEREARPTDYDKVKYDKDRDINREHRRHRDRSSSISSLHDRERGRERERDRGSLRERDIEKPRDISRERYRERDRPTNVSREKERDRYGYDRDRGRNRDREVHLDEREHGRKTERDRVNDRDKRRDYRHSSYDERDQHRDKTRSKELAKELTSAKHDSHEGKRQSLREEDEEDYQERIEQQLAKHVDEDLDKIKEESRKRRQAILEKYKQQQPQKLIKSPSKDHDKAENATFTGTDAKESAGQLLSGSDAKQDSSDVYVAESSFAVGKSPMHNGTSTPQKKDGAGGLGEGTPKSERSADMFCDDIFGESPVGIRKTGKGDAVQIERSGLHDNWDDAEGYYSYRFGEILDGRYEVIAAHGKGVFSTVVRAKDLKAGKDDPEEVAIKIIRNNDTMYKAGQEELRILGKLVATDPEDKRHCVRFLSSFKYRNHLCLIFESLHMNLREVLKKFGRNIGLKLTAVRAYAKQLFIALKHLKNCGVLHCDIKPDNMLVNEAKTVLKLCDFGNAMFAAKNEPTPYLVSRFYRAPEIILGLEYDHPLDIWSVGCCLYELYCGKVLFPGPSNNDMLRLHMELKGSFPKKMLRKGAFTNQHFDQDLNFHATEEDPVTRKTVNRLLMNIKPKDISSLISSSPGEDPKLVANFKDLLERIFILDPEKRMTVSQALSHPFITGK